jgi:ribosome-associated protein
LSKLNSADNKTKTTLQRLNRTSKLFKVIDIVSLDLRKIHEAVADFFIICQANNNNQLKAIADFVEEEVKRKCGENPYKQEGRMAQQWILIDYVNIVVHILLPEPRKFYQLEEMWSDAPMMQHPD